MSIDDMLKSLITAYLITVSAKIGSRCVKKAQQNINIIAERVTDLAMLLGSLAGTSLRYLVC